MQNKWTRYFLTFLHEWGLFILFISLFLLTRLFLWLPVQVEGHSMDPTLADGQRVIVLKHTSIERFDIVVAKEVENGKTKQIVKRIIGMPGDTITYQNDKLTINGKEVKEEYLKEFHAAFAKDKLQKEYAYSDYFQQLAKESKAFTVNADKNTTFSVTVPEGKSYSEITVSFQKIAAKLVTLTRVLLSGKSNSASGHLIKLAQLRTTKNTK
mgnify:CR=1 FL=1